MQTLLGATLAAQWPGLRSLILVRRRRDVDGKVSDEWAYYISSLDQRRTARQLASYIRGHWGIDCKQEICGWDNDSLLKVVTA